MSFSNYFRAIGILVSTCLIAACGNNSSPTALGSTSLSSTSPSINTRPHSNDGQCLQTDDQGNCTETCSDTSSPVALFVAPTSGQTVSGNTQVVFEGTPGQVNDPSCTSQITDMTLYLDGVGAVAEVGGPDGNYNLNTLNLLNGNHVLTLDVTDEQGGTNSQVISFEVSNPIANVCSAGTYNISVNGGALVPELVISSVSSTDGSFAATYTNSSGVFPFNGVCANGLISFAFDGNNFHGSYDAQNNMSGTFTFNSAGPYPWNAAYAGPPPPPPPPPASVCVAGNYNVVLAGNQNYAMTIASVSSSTGAIKGDFVGVGNLNGTCANGSISFLVDGNSFSGTYDGSGNMKGTDVYSGASYPWSAKIATPPPPPTSICVAGNYNVVLAGNQNYTMTIASVNSSTGTITGDFVGIGNLAGSCGDGSISFAIGGNSFSGTYDGTGNMSGTDVFQGQSYSWSAKIAIPPASVCVAGTYSVVLAGNQNYTMTIASVNSSTGAFTASWVNLGSFTGTCANGSISFALDGNSFGGVYDSSGNMKGTDTFQGQSYSWTAQIAAPPAAVCVAGTYSVVLAGNQHYTMTIASVNSSTGSFTASWVNLGSFTGTCANGSISFALDGNSFGGVYDGSGNMSGTDIFQSTPYPWTASRTGP